MMPRLKVTSKSGSVLKRYVMPLQKEGSLKSAAQDMSKTLVIVARQRDMQEWLPEDAPAESSDDAQTDQEESNWKRQYKTESYAVRRPLWNDIIMRLGGEVPSVDAFAEKKLHLLEKWWGPGSQCPDAFKKRWSQERLLWCNAPFSMLAEVVKKIREDRARAILVVPNWTNQKWFEDLQDMVLKKAVLQAWHTSV